MGNLLIATIIITVLNLLMWFSQIGALDINPAGTSCYHVEGSIIGQQMQNGTLNNDIMNQLPESSTTGVTSGNSGGFVTDLFNNILAWFKSIKGINYMINVIAAPYNILKCAGLPNTLVTGLGTLWYAVSLLIFLSFLWWRD
jgi:hypothetical protein